MLSQHPMSRQLSSLQVVDLVQGVARYPNTSQLVEVIWKHPVAQQIGSFSFLKLFKTFSDHSPWANGVPGCVQLLLRHPAAAALDTSVLFDIVQEALASESSPAVTLLLKLPAAQQLSAEHVRLLLQQALQVSNMDCVNLLKAHPAAAVDAELQLLLDFVESAV